MAAAADLEACAEGILRMGLAETLGTVRINQALSALSDRADRRTLVAISSLLLSRDPPPWLSLAAQGGMVFREYIPSTDLRALEWLEPYLDQLLVEAAGIQVRNHIGPLREALGRAGELVILAAAAEAGSFAVHVADISDLYGYDIEIQTPFKQRLEVKSTTNANDGFFHLSRNEFDKCRQHGQEWRLVQVTFDSSVFTDELLFASHVSGIRELRWNELLDLVPADTAYFRWTESAVIQPPRDSWLPSAIQVPESLQLPGIREILASLKPSA